ncbi:MAG: hypothetical protein OXU75_12845 [Deltaproteobacteria bacterium]|nr:hypothetical protein [Deltaproteobacteria bacterium]
MADAVFLSASIPDPKRGPEYAATADAVAIASAVSALMNVTLGRRLLVWGGHPAITPMIWAVAETINIDYGSWVRLYQSLHFSDDFPEDNERFHNVTFTDDIENDRQKSLTFMRERMLSDYRYTAGVFIGGMEGILEEFNIFRRLQPNAAIVPVVSTGGAVVELAGRLPHMDQDLRDDLDYVAVFHRHLNVSVQEARFNRPTDQPVAPELRLWRRFTTDV